jgi:hypothetical protein
MCQVNSYKANYRHSTVQIYITTHNCRKTNKQTRMIETTVYFCSLKLRCGSHELLTLCSDMHGGWESLVDMNSDQ